MDPTITVHEAGKVRAAAYFKEVMRHRRLILLFARRELRARYAQTLLGVCWTAAQPLFWLTVFWIFFGYIFKMNTEPVPYPVFLFTGLVTWHYFITIAQRSSTVLIESGDLINSIYYPKLILLLARLLTSTFDCIIHLLILAVMLIAWRQVPGSSLMAFPLAFAASALAGITVGIWVSALSIRYRDAQQILPLLLQGAIWITPVFFQPSVLPESLHWIFYCNPVAGAVALSRWAFLNTPPPEIWYLLGTAFNVMLLATGYYVFIRSERAIADHI